MRVKREPIALTILEERPPAEAQLDRRLRKSDSTRAKVGVCLGEIVADEEDVRGGQRVGRARPVTPTRAENEDRAVVRCSDLDPALLTIGRVLMELEPHRLRPKLERARLIVDLDHNLAHPCNHRALLPLKRSAARARCANPSGPATRTSRAPR